MIPDLPFIHPSEVSLLSRISNLGTYYMQLREFISQQTSMCTSLHPTQPVVEHHCKLFVLWSTMSCTCLYLCELLLGVLHAQVEVSVCLWVAGVFVCLLIYFCMWSLSELLLDILHARYIYTCMFAPEWPVAGSSPQLGWLCVSAYLSVSEPQVC